MFIKIMLSIFKNIIEFEMSLIQYYLNFNINFKCINMILTIFDLETTGLDRNKDQIIQFSAMKIDTDTNKVISEYDQYIEPVGNY